MKRPHRATPGTISQPGYLASIGLAILLAFLTEPIMAKEASPTPTTAPPAAAASTDTAAAVVKLPPEQLESLVAPIALYPDALLAQTLVASTYPLEIVQLQQWLGKHKDLKGDALADSVAKEYWDPSIQSMAILPEVVDRLANDIRWTTDLGNAFLAQQQDVMDAIQRMRKKAKEKGALESNEQQKVETQVVEEKTIIVVESTNPEVIYVPSYSPTVVYGAPIYYPYPPIYYPPYPPGAAFVSFGIGLAWGAAWGGSCCGCGWHGGGNININVNNNFNQINHNNNFNGGRGQGGGGGNWSHNASHRGAAPYGDKATANKFGGDAKGQGRASNKGGATASNRAGGAGAGNKGGAGVSNRAGGSAGNKAGGAGVSNRAGSAGAGNKAGSASVSNRAGSAGSGNKAGSAGVSNRSGSASRGGDQIGNRSIPKSSSSRSSSGLSGGSRGYSGSSARSSSSRGSSSRGGGGGGGGGSRGGGGGRRG